MQPASVDILTLTVRPVRASDEPLIFDAWLNSYRETLQPGPARGWGSARDRYYRDQRRRIRMLLERGATVLVACDPDDQDLLLGFICVEGPLVHYVYVKQAFRENGVALQLLAAAGLGGASPLLATHWSSACDAIALKRPGLLQYVGLDVPHVMEGAVVRADHRSSH